MPNAHLKKSNRKRVLISHVYSAANNGDAALLKVLIKELNRVLDRPELAAATLDHVPDGEVFNGVPLKRSLMNIALNTHKSRPAKFVYSFYMMGATLAAVWVWRKTGRLPLGKRLLGATRDIIDADAMVPVGGGYLRGKPGIASFMELLLLLHPIVLAKLAGKQVLHHSQSVGPFGSKLQEWLAAKTLQKVDFLAIREDVSMEILRGMKVPAATRAVDAGFLLEGGSSLDLRQILGVPPGQTLVGVTVRQWLGGEGQAAYEQAVARLCDHILKTGGSVVFIPQVTAEKHSDDDRVASRRVAALMQREGAHVLEQTYDCDTIKSLYGSLDYMIGTRFHSVIFSLTSGVPAIAIEYEHKTRGIMQDLGLQEWVRDINTVNSKELIKLYDDLKTKHKSYSKTLSQELPGYIKTAHNAADEIARRL